MRTAPEPWLTKRELAAKLRVSTRTVSRLRLPYVRVGGQNRYLMSRVIAALEGVPAGGGAVIRFPVERTRKAVA